MFVKLASLGHTGPMSTASAAEPVDPRMQRSRTALLDAATRLLDVKPVSEISITRLVEEAGVTRPTFYQHFPDIPAIARAAAIARLAAASPIPEPIPVAELTPAQIRDVIATQFLPDLVHLAEHRDFYLRVLDGATDLHLLTELVTLSLERTTPEPFEHATRGHDTTAHDLMTLVAGGTTWLILTWLRDSSHTPDVLASRIATTVASTLGYHPDTRP